MSFELRIQRDRFFLMLTGLDNAQDIMTRMGNTCLSPVPKGQLFHKRGVYFHPLQWNAFRHCTLALSLLDSVCPVDWTFFCDLWLRTKLHRIPYPISATSRRTKDRLQRFRQYLDCKFLVGVRRSFSSGVSRNTGVD